MSLKGMVGSYVTGRMESIKLEERTKSGDDIVFRRAE